MFQKYDTNYAEKNLGKVIFNKPQNEQGKSTKYFGIKKVNGNLICGFTDPVHRCTNACLHMYVVGDWDYRFLSILAIRRYL